MDIGRALRICLPAGLSTRCPLVIAQLKTCSSRCRVRLAAIGAETMRLQDLEDVGGGDFGDLPATERSGGMVKAGNPLRGVFVVAPSGTAQLNHFIGSFPERRYAANPPSVCLSRPLVIQNVPTQVFKGDVRLSGESRNLRHPPTATPSKLRAATKPVPKITQIKRITVQEQAPPHPPPHNHPHPSLL